MKKSTFFYLICLIILASCHKDQDVFVPQDQVDPLYVTGSVGGVISDISGLVLTNTSVRLKTKDAILETKTDENGVFYFKNIELNAAKNYLFTESDGYFTGTRSFISGREDIEFVNISLLPRSQMVSFEASNGGVFDDFGSGRIVFLANALEDAEGVLYSGAANLAAVFLPNNNLHAGLATPGGFLAKNEEGELRALAAFGMMTFELTTDAGELLYLANENTATINIPIPSDQLAVAPVNIPLWYFDETEEHWLEEGTALLVEDHYEGQVTHAGFWTCARAYSTANIKSHVYFSNLGIPYSNAAVKITVVGSGVCAYGFTDNKGAFDFAVPEGQVLLLQLFGRCGDVLYEAEIGPYFSNTDLGNVIIELASNDFVQLSGQLVDCQEEVVSEGYTKIKIAEEEFIFFVSETGEFNINFDVCAATEFSLSGIDLVNSEQSTSETHQITEVVALGTISICE